MERVPVEADVRLRFDDVQELIREMAGNLSLGGMFVTSDQPRPVGARLQFDLRLADETPIVRGRGEVAWVRGPSLGSTRAPGMGVRFTEVDPLGKEIIFKVVDLFIQQGGTPFDIDRGAEG